MVARDLTYQQKVGFLSSRKNFNKFAVFDAIVDELGKLNYFSGPGGSQPVEAIFGQDDPRKEHFAFQLDHRIDDYILFISGELPDKDFLFDILVKKSIEAAEGGFTGDGVAGE
jgi:hypothetical protein